MLVLREGMFMNEYDFIKMLSELAKIGINNNSNFTEWEKWWRKTGVEVTMQYAREYYPSRLNTDNSGK